MVSEHYASGNHNIFCQGLLFVWSQDHLKFIGFHETQWRMWFYTLGCDLTEDNEHVPHWELYTKRVSNWIIFYIT